jgi:REP element-mobilizing transposase RayT
LRIRRSNRTKALNILDQFHIVAKLNRTLDQVHADQVRRLRQDGQESVANDSLVPPQTWNEQAFPSDCCFVCSIGNVKPQTIQNYICNQG